MESLCKIRDLYRAIYDFENYFEKKYNLSLNEGMLLCCLKDSDRITSGEIASSLNLSGPNTSKLIKLIESKGLMSRYIDENDRRLTLLQITPKGVEKIKSIKCDQIEIPEIIKAAIK